MIVFTGAVKLLEAQAAYIATCSWGLGAADIPDDLPTTTLSDCLEVSWTGYARVVVGPLALAFLDRGEAWLVPETQPEFLNSSGAMQQFQLAVLIDPDDVTLVSYSLLSPQPVLIPDTGRYHLAGAAVLTGL